MRRVLHLIHPQNYESRTLTIRELPYIKVIYTALLCGLKSDVGGAKTPKMF